MSIDSKTIGDELAKAGFADDVKQPELPGYKFFEYVDKESGKVVHCHTDGKDFQIEQNGHAVQLPCSMFSTTEELIAEGLKALGEVIGDTATADKLQTAIDEAKPPTDEPL